MRVFLVLGLCVAWLGNAHAQSLETSQGQIRVETMATGLDEPWAVDILPDGSFLVTERAGRLLRFVDEKPVDVHGLPAIEAHGQGGLLDITVARDFAQSRELFLTYASKSWRKNATTVAVARLSKDGRRLENLRELFKAEPASFEGRHYGSRVVEAPDGSLFVTLGERGDRPSAQDLGSHNGTVIRITRDGKPYRHNPFLGRRNAQPEIWSYGHRNAQGAALDLDGRLWIVEHGAKGGDEVNRIRQGANYGWPVIAFGKHYSGAKIGEGTHKDGMEQPDFYWDPSIAPSGMMIYSGKLWPDWRGDIFVGSLKFHYISRLKGAPLREVEQIKNRRTRRVRDIIEAPDGSIWFISVGNGAVYRLAPG